jgi:hypothetical protein
MQRKVREAGAKGKIIDSVFVSGDMQHKLSEGRKNMAGGQKFNTLFFDMQQKVRR